MLQNTENIAQWSLQDLHVCIIPAGKVTIFVIKIVTFSARKTNIYKIWKHDNIFPILKHIPTKLFSFTISVALL